ncbi:MAG: hypothetical protein M0Z61_01935, partial [Nitrospiraceae bacterium]|nr:hypothetical protein [Nitrospiraceae bacterium]
MEKTEIKERLKDLPSIDETLKSEEGRKWISLYPRRFVLKAVRKHIEDLRSAIIKGESTALDAASV